MKLIAALPVLIAFLVGALPAHAWTWPVAGPVLQPFQLGSDPYAAGQHRGIDIGAPLGTAVVAPASGLVSFAGTVPRGGRTVTIATRDGYAVTLVHLGSIGAARGTAVAEGSPIGAVGPSGEAEHAEGYVHLGIRVEPDPQGYLDPLSLLPAAPSPSPADEAEAPASGEAPAGDPPAEPADQEHGTPAETGSPDAEEAAHSDPVGEAESPTERGSEEVPAEPPVEAQHSGEESGRPRSAVVETQAAPAPVTDRAAEPPARPGSAPRLEAALGEAQAAWSSAARPAYGRGETAVSPALEHRTQVRDGILAETAARPGNPSLARDRSAEHVAGNGAGHGPALLLGSAALVILGAIGTEWRRRRRASSSPLSHDFSTGSASRERLSQPARDEERAPAEVDVWLAELLSPRAPCRSRLVRAGPRAAACRGPLPRHGVTRSRAAPGQVARSARTG